MASLTSNELLERALNTTRRLAVALLAVVMVTTGLVVLALGESADPLVSAVGTTLLATGTLALGWELVVRHHQDRVQRRNTFDAVASRWSEPSEGLIRVGRAIFQSEELARALAQCRLLRATCLYDQHWSEAQWGEPLRQFFGRPGTRAEFILPNPDDEELMTRLAARHQLEAESGRTAGQRMESRVRELIARLKDVSKVRPTALDIHLLDGWGPSYTSYLFSRRSDDGLGVTRQYGHAMGTGEPLPETLFAENGELWKHAWADYERLRARAHR